MGCFNDSVTLGTHHDQTLATVSHYGRIPSTDVPFCASNYFSIIINNT